MIRHWSISVAVIAIAIWRIAVAWRVEKRRERELEDAEHTAYKQQQVSRTKVKHVEDC